MTCSECRYYDNGICKRFPISRPKEPLDWCGEGKLPVKEARKAKLVAEHPRFAEFYSYYHKKQDRPEASKAFWKQPEANHQAIIDAAVAWTGYWVRENKEMKYIKLPATFINKETWRERPPMHERGPKDCVDCGAAYVAGKHKLVSPITTPPTFRCEQCRIERNKA